MAAIALFRPLSPSPRPALGIAVSTTKLNTEHEREGGRGGPTGVAPSPCRSTAARRLLSSEQRLKRWGERESERASAERVRCVRVRALFLQLCGLRVAARVVFYRPSGRPLRREMPIDSRSESGGRQGLLRLDF